MSRGRHQSGADACLRRELVVLEPSERRAAVLRLINGARRRLKLSLFRCDDYDVLDALADALRRGVRVEVLLTPRARGGRRRLKALWRALAGMGAVVRWYGDATVKYHAKYLVADSGPALVTSLNPTRKCFTRTWDAVVVTHDRQVVRGLLHLFASDMAGRAPALGASFSKRLIVGPERARADVHALIDSARQSIRILDHKLSDPSVVDRLRARRAVGVEVTVIGGPSAGPLESHGKVTIVDGSRALVGSIAMTPRSLDARRELGLVLEDPGAVHALTAAYDALRAGSECFVHSLAGGRT